MIIHEGKPQVSVSANRPIPATIRICNPIRKTADACEGFVGDTDDVVVKIVEWVADVPRKFSATLTVAVRWGRDWIIGILKPPDWIHFFPRAESVGLGRSVVKNKGSLISNCAFRM